jgi:1-acyl-sn-glycerol-3-phosphate acyltransferase
VLGAPQPTAAYRLAAHMLVPIFNRVFRLEAVGAERVPRGGAVLGANQLSNVDAFALATPLFPRPLRAMAKAELFNPLLGPVVRSFGAFPVDRDGLDSGAVDAAVAMASAGELVLIFPEGTRRRKGLRKSRVARPHAGAAHVALVAGVPLVPAAIRGTDRLTRLRPWRIAYGEPVSLGDLADLPLREARREATRRLWERIVSLELELATWDGGRS